MKIYGLNGSPRKRNNTAQLLEKCLEGASEKAETKLIHLYDYSFKGCLSCLACKSLKRKTACQCVVQDEISPLLEELSRADALILGAPLYLGDVSSGIRAFMERFLYPFYDPSLTAQGKRPTKFKGSINSAFIYTMNMDKQGMEQNNYAHFFDQNRFYLENMLQGKSTYLCACNTFQTDRSDFIARDREKNKKARELFPSYLDQAHELGKALLSP
ncbi:MAG: flavodoxin family protein [Spirochaetales bacterium]|nr:flavodoxin family protein [Spirochaetales bacterium]